MRGRHTFALVFAVLASLAILLITHSPLLSALCGRPSALCCLHFLKAFLFALSSLLSFFAVSSLSCTQLLFLCFLLPALSYLFLCALLRLLPPFFLFAVLSLSSLLSSLCYLSTLFLLWLFLAAPCILLSTSLLLTSLLSVVSSFISFLSLCSLLSLLPLLSTLSSRFSYSIPFPVSCPASLAFKGHKQKSCLTSKATHSTQNDTHTHTSKHTHTHAHWPIIRKAATGWQSKKNCPIADILAAIRSQQQQRISEQRKGGAMRWKRGRRRGRKAHWGQPVA